MSSQTGEMPGQIPGQVAGQMPGQIPGQMKRQMPHDKECRTCTDFQSWLRMKGAQVEKKKTKPSGEAESQRGPHVDESATEKNEVWRRQCPLDSAALGRATWGLLHTVAASYPERPSPAQQRDVTTFLQVMSRVYPCEPCAADFRSELSREPPDVTSGATLARWLCRQHNVVNRKLGKNEFDCELVDQRWKDGWQDGSCG